MLHVDKIEFSCSTAVCYIPHTMHELHLVETQPLSHSRRQTLKQLRYNRSQTIIYHCADGASGIRLQIILLIVQTVYQVLDCRPYFSLCRQCIRYQMGDHGNVPDDNSLSVQAEEVSIPKDRDSMRIIP